MVRRHVDTSRYMSELRKALAGCRALLWVLLEASPGSEGWRENDLTCGAMAIVTNLTNELLFFLRDPWPVIKS